MYINMNITHIAKRNALIDKVISTMPKISLDNKKELTNKAIRILQDRLEQIVPKTYEDSKHIKPVISEIFHFQKSLKTKLGHCLEEMAAVGPHSLNVNISQVPKKKRPKYVDLVHYLHNGPCTVEQKSSSNSQSGTGAPYLYKGLKMYNLSPPEEGSKPFPAHYVISFPKEGTENVTQTKFQENKKKYRLDTYDYWTNIVGVDYYRLEQVWYDKDKRITTILNKLRAADGRKPIPE